MKNVTAFLLVMLLILSCSEGTKSTKVITVCGTVSLSEGCGDETDSLIAYGIALIHHMTYAEAEGVFDQVIEKSPDCFWGYWGKAMTFIHPLWPDVTSEEHLKEGWELTEKAMILGKTEREIQYAEVLSSFFLEGLKKSEKERLHAMETSWHMVFAQNSEDLEGKLFYSLYLMSGIDFSDKSYTKQKKAGQLAEDLRMAQLQMS